VLGFASLPWLVAALYTTYGDNRQSPPLAASSASACDECEIEQHARFTPERIWEYFE
jgi:hypothetical protein